MTRKFALLFFVLLFLAFALIFFRWHKAGRHTVVAEQTKLNSQLDIGIIGDSYVEGKMLDTIVSNYLLQQGQHSTIFSSGKGGANSRLIYENLFMDSTYKYSSNKVFHNNTKYCIVIGGVNDAIGQYGATFYSYHMTLILHALLDAHIKPVVVTLPEFGIQETENSFNSFKKIRNTIFGCFTGNGFDSTIHDYRRALSEELTKQHLNDSIVLVNYDNVISNYKKDKVFFFNSAHLNLIGRQRLGRQIAKSVLYDIKSNPSKFY